jgi:hypothetical protein
MVIPLSRLYPLVLQRKSASKLKALCSRRYFIFPDYIMSYQHNKSNILPIPYFESMRISIFQYILCLIQGKVSKSNTINYLTLRNISGLSTIRFPRNIPVIRKKRIFYLLCSMVELAAEQI